MKRRINNDVVDYEVTHPNVDRRGWIRLRWEGVRPRPPFPRVCVSCLISTDERRAYRLGRDLQLSIGLCSRCAKEWNHRKNLVGMWVGTSAITLCTTIFVVVGLSTGNWLWALMSAAPPLFIIAFAVQQMSFRWLEPIQLKGLAAVRVRFRNAKFMRIYLGIPDWDRTSAGHGKGTEKVETEKVTSKISE